MYAGAFRVATRMLAALMTVTPVQGDLNPHSSSISFQSVEAEPGNTSGRMEVSMTGVTLTRRGVALVAEGISSGGMPGSVMVLVWRRGESEGRERLRLEIEFRCGEGKITAVGRVSALPPRQGSSIRSLGGTLRLEDGVGVFRSATGPLHIRGTVDTYRRTARLEYRRASFPPSNPRLIEIPD